MKILVGSTPTPEGVAALDGKLITGSTAQGVLLNTSVPVICVPGPAKTG